MKKFQTAILAAVLVLGLSGCSLFQSPNAAFVTGIDAGLNGDAALLSKYEKYVDADPKLTADSKAIEKKTVAALRKLIADAKN